MESETTVLKGKTVGDLFDFLSRAVILKEISESLSAHLRAAVKKIFLATCPPHEFWRDVPLESVCLDERIATLRTNNRGECSEETIHVYKKRYERSLRLYLDWLSRQPVQNQSLLNPPEQNQFEQSQFAQSSLRVDSPKPEISVSEPSLLERLLLATSLSAKASLMTLLSTSQLLDDYRVLAASSDSKIGYFVFPKDFSSADLERMLKEISPLLVVNSDVSRDKGEVPP